MDEPEVSNVENEEEIQRKQRIHSLIEGIRTEGQKRKRPMSRPKQNSSASGIGQKGRKRYTLNIGWLHYQKSKYRVVTGARGGGTRTFTYDKEEPMTVEKLMEMGKKLFFPENKSTHGSLDDMDVSVGNLSGTDITAFKDLDGNECSFQEYLHSNGLYSSQFHIYFKTCLKENEPEKKNEAMNTHAFVVNNKKPGNMIIKFKRSINSAYDGETSVTSCQSTDSCIDLSSSHEDEMYNPLENGYVVSSIKIEGITHMEEDEINNNKPVFPQDTNLPNEGMIIHGPDEIFGYECGRDSCRLYLGVVVNKQSEMCFSWFKDEQLCASGKTLSIIQVREPGVYKLSMTNIDNVYLFDVNIDVKEFEHPAHSSEQLQTTIATDHETAIGQSTGAHITGISPQDNGVTSIVVTGVLPQDIGAIPTPMTSVSQENCVFPTTMTEISSQDNIVITTPVTDVSPQDSGVATLSMVGVSPQESSVITTLRTEVLSEDIIDISVPIKDPMTGVSPQKRLCCTNQMTDVLLSDSVVDTADLVGPPQKESRTGITTMTGISGKEPTCMSTSLEDPSASSILQSGELTTALVKIPSTNLHIEQEINRGAFGVVFKAQWNGTDVAVKQLAVKRMKKMKKMLARELEISATIRHPNIVLLMGYNVEENQLNLISEYVNGPNLDQVLFSEGEFAFPLEKKALTAYQVCAAVTYLHNRYPLILHRDIKPDNIVLTKCLNTAKLCDMGLSKFKSMTTMITTMASGNFSQPGTLAYQAPEVLLQSMSASSETDIWSLCATLVELFSEETVWETELRDEKENETSFECTIRDSMRSRKQPDGLTALFAMTLPVKVKELIASGLKFEPESRPVAIELCKLFREMCCRFNI